MTLYGDIADQLGHHATEATKLAHAVADEDVAPAELRQRLRLLEHTLEDVHSLTDKL